MGPSRKFCVKTRPYTLRRAAAVIFALLSVLPLLLFTYTIYALDMPRHSVAQIALGSALLLSMIGFYIYSVMISRLANILRDLEADEAAQPPSGTTQGSVVTMGVGARGGLVVPGMGRITELKPATASALSAVDSMWRAEAEPLLDKRVLVTVRNAHDPMKGILVQVTQDGLILDQNGTRVGISYTRVSAIETDTTPGPGSRFLSGAQGSGRSTGGVGQTALATRPSPTSAVDVGEQLGSSFDWDHREP